MTKKMTNDCNVRFTFRLFIALFFLMFTGNNLLVAQGACAWVEPSDGWYNSGATNTYIYGLVSNTNGSIVIAGSTKDVSCSSNGQRYAYISKINSNGTLAWMNMIGDDTYATDFGAAAGFGSNPLIATADGGYAMAGITAFNYATIIKTNASGVWQWSTQVAGGTPNEYFNDLVQTTDGGFIGVGQSGSAPNFFAAKISSDGSTLQWTQTMGGSGAYNSIIKTSDGGYAMCGYQLAVSSPTWKRAYICKVDASFTLQWNVSYGTQDAGCDGIAGRGLPSAMANDIAQTPEGGYIIAGQKYMPNCQFSNNNCYMIKLDATGTLQWTKTIGGTGTGTGLSNDIARSVVVAADNNYVFAGLTENFGVNPKSDAYLLKMNSLGTIMWQKPIHIATADADQAYCLATSSVGTDIYMGGYTFVSTVCLAGPFQTGYLSEILLDGSVCCSSTTTNTVLNISSDDTHSTPAFTTGAIGSRTSVTASTCATTPTTGFCTFCTSGSCDIIKPTCGTFTITPLMPVELLSFNALCNSGVVKCEWTTASETNNNYFSVERSEDGQTFQEIGTVKGSGSSSLIHSYEFVDFEIASQTSTFYYRIKQIDYDGQYEYYGSVPVSCSPPHHWSLMLKNPVAEGVLKGTLFLVAAEEVSISVIDLQGRIIRQERFAGVKGSNLLQMDLSNIQNGMYIVTVSERYRSIQRKFIKNDL